MSTFTSHTRAAMVRPGFTEEDIYRDALGPWEPLRVAVICGPLDAPEWMPSGSTRPGSKCGAAPTTHQRDGHREL